jgi:hypothetical protein
MIDKGLQNFAAVLVSSLGALPAGRRAALMAYAEAGGTLISGPALGKAEGDDYAERPHGKGRLVIYKDDPPDAETVARDMREHLGPALGLKLFNAPSTLPYLVRDGRRAVVRLVNYSREEATQATLRAAGAFTRASMSAPGVAPAALTLEKADDGVDVLIPKLRVAATVVFE